MPTTSNFGWTTPADTDLVKDGASAIRTLGNNIDSSMAQLKGGTTGQVLSKTSGTDMAFTWVTQDDANAIQNTIVDAKGDLITATANDTPARLAVGSNGDTLVADSAASTGLRWQGNYAAGKNKIINGAFDIWQRGTSINLTNNTTGYVADRFSNYVSFSAGTCTVSRQTFTPGSAPVAGYEGQFFHRLAFPASGTISYWETTQLIEDVRTFAGQTVTLSFWAKASTNVTVKNYLSQIFGSGGSSSVTTSGTNASVTTSWTRFTSTITLPSISGKTVGTNNCLSVTLYNDAGAATSVTIDVWGVQLEAGSVATAFQTATGTLQGELAACQRYYFRFTGNTSQTIINYAFAGNSTTAQGKLQFPVPMRVAPTSLDSATLKFQNYGGSGYAMTSVAYNEASAFACQVYGTVSGVTAGHAGAILGDATGSYVGLSAEL